MTLTRGPLGVASRSPTSGSDVPFRAGLDDFIHWENRGEPSRRTHAEPAPRDVNNFHEEPFMFASTLRSRVFAGLTAAMVASSIGAAAGAVGSKPHSATFSMFPQNSLVNCLKPTPDAPNPTVKVTVNRGDLNDTASVNLRGFKPGLAFDLFTIQHSPQTATGTPDANPSVGLAWYQTDLQVQSDGTGQARIRTVLLDQIFGVDKDVSLPPTNTFNLGFWFNNPSDAGGCGFNGVTPFNGAHQAGPLAFVTRPNPTTNLGPLCTSPTSDTAGTITCNP
jgi:hypothetical protein